MNIFLIFILLSTAAHAGPSALNQLVYDIRNPSTESAHFRQSLESIGEYLALNVLEELNTESASVVTLTGALATHNLPSETPVLVTILRAGLPLNAGVLKVFPKAEVGFLAMSRDEETLKAKVDYVALPLMNDKCVIITDTMLATGGSMLDAIQIIESYKPKKIFVISAIAATPGIERLHAYRPDIRIFSAAIDPMLNEKGYIIPGLGDAGDRSFGLKVKP